MIIGYITGQELQIQAPVIVSDSINFLTAQFFFQTEEWRGLSKWAHFKQGENVYDFALEDDRIEKDAHLNLSDGEWEIYIHGNEFADGEVIERITTEIVTLAVKKSGVLEGEPFAEQPATEVERLNAKLDKFLETGVGGKVSSVNGKDGDIVLTAEDVGALPADTEIPSVPEKVSAFENDAEYQTADEVAETVKASADAIEKKIPTIPKNVSEFTNDARYQSAEQVQATVSKKAEDIVAQIPTVPAEISAFRNDAKYQTEEQVNAKALEVEGKIPTVPSNVSAFNNDADYATRIFVQETVNGKNLAFVFDSVADLDTWLSDSENVSRLKTGDVFWIRDTEVPDYWWDGESKTKQIMETTKVDLSEYALKTEIPVKTSDLQNDSDFATNAGVDTKLGGYQPKLSEYVQTVNGKSGAVNLTASDVGALPSTTKIPVVPTNVSAFENDAEYATEDAVKEGLEALKEEIKDECLGASGFYIVPYEYTYTNSDMSEDLPEGIYDGLLQAYNEGKICYLKCIFTSENLETYARAYFAKQNNDFEFLTMVEDTLCGAIIYSNNTISSSSGFLGNRSFVDHMDRIISLSKAYRMYENNDNGFYGGAFPSNKIFIQGLNTKQDTLTFDSAPTAGSQNPVTSDGIKTAIDEAADCIFWIQFKLGNTGFELDGVTHADIIAAWNDGKRVIGRAYVPQEANMGIEGDFEFALNYIRSDDVIVFTFVSGAIACEVFVKTDNSVFTIVKELAEAKEDTASASVYYINIAVENLTVSQTLGLDPAVVAGAVDAYSSGKVVMVRNAKAAGIQFFELLECIGPQGVVVNMAFRVRKGNLTSESEANAAAVLNVMQNMLFIDNNYS